MPTAIICSGHPSSMRPLERGRHHRSVLLSLATDRHHAYLTADTRAGTRSIPGAKRLVTLSLGG